MGLVTEAGFQCDVAHGPVALQEQLSRPFDPAFHDIAVDWKSCGVSEQGFEVRHAEAGDVGQLFEREVAIEVRLDVVADSAEAPFRELAFRDVRDSCWVVAGSLQQSSCDRCSEAVQKYPAVGIACRAFRSEAPADVFQVRVAYTQGGRDFRGRGL